MLRLGLVQAIGTYSDPTEGDPNDIAVPLVKRYFRQVAEGAPVLTEMQGCGLHGLLSRGPFNSPGKSKIAQTLFNHFAKLAMREVKKFIQSRMEERGKDFLCHSRDDRYSPKQLRM